MSRARPPLGLLVSPFANACRRAPGLAERLAADLGPADVWRAPASLVELEAAARVFAERDLRNVAIVGGDGTISLTLTALLRQYGARRLPRLLLLRGGTMNVVAANLGLAGDPARLLRRYVACLAPGAPRPSTRSFPCLWVGERAGFVFAAGAAARFLRVYYQRQPTPRRAALLFAKLAMSSFSRQGKDGFFATTMEPVPVRVRATPRLGRGDAEDLYSMIFAATVPNLAFDVPFFRAVDPSQRRAELVALTRSDRLLVVEGLRLVLRRGLSRQGIVRALFERATLTPGALLDYSIDGDMAVAQPGENVELRVGPRVTFMAGDGAEPLPGRRFCCYGRQN